MTIYVQMIIAYVNINRDNFSCDLRDDHIQDVHPPWFDMNQIDVYVFILSFGIDS